MLLLCALVGSIPSLWAQSDYSANFTGNITLSSTGGSNASACVVKVNSGDAGYAGIKAGTSSKVGAVKIAVPSGTKYLHLHVAGWNAETVSLAVTPTGYSTNISLTSDSGISGGTPFTLNASSKATTDYYKVITFSSALTADTDLTFTASGGKRFVIWGVTAEEGSVGPTTDPTITFNNGSVSVGKTLNLSTLFTSNSTGAVTYTITSGDSYASISGSTLTGVAEGEVSVRASQAASASYNAKTADATITVTAAKVLSSIAITTPPTKTSYAPGEYFNPDGMVVTATYADTSTDDVTALCTFTPSTTTALTVGINEIEVSYTENAVTKTATQAITIIDYATLPFSYDGGRSNLPMGLTANDLGTDYPNSPKLKFDDKDDYLILKIGTYPGTLTYNIKGNSFSDGTFKVQVSANGTDYTDIKTYTSFGSSTKSETISNIDKNVRYIKWVYTSKGSGNVALGKIQLTAGDGKDPSDLAYAVPSYKVAADLNNFPIPTLTNPHGLTVVYSSNDEEIAMVDENDGFVAIGTKIGTATITATFAGNDSYRAGTATYTITTYDPNANDGSELKPYTVTEALALINTLGTASSSPVYVKGIVSTELSDINSTNGYANYYISVDGTTTAQLECYKGYNLGNTKFATTSDLSLGDEVVVYGSLKMYNTTPEFNQNNFISQLKHGSEPEVRSIEVKAANKYKSYVSSQNLVVPAGVTAYIATGETATELTLTSVPKIKAGTPVILYANASEDTGFSFQITDDEVTYPATNLLKISDGTVVNGAYVLAKKNDVVGFYKWAGGALSPGKVYVEPSSAAREFIGFNFDEVTGINEVKNEKETVNGIFDLQGRKVVTPSKGLYIVNGKKVVIK